MYKALIFDSGYGKRLRPFTDHHPKCLTPLESGETIFERQIRLLHENGIDHVVVTTGPFPEQMKRICEKAPFNTMAIEFVQNDFYLSSNAIVSMNLAAEKIRGHDVIIMHGDLVFDRRLLGAILRDKRPNLVCISQSAPLPEKDFVGYFEKGFLRTIKVGDRGVDRYALQPLYKISHSALDLWLDKVASFCAEGNTNVYAENALNEIAESARVEGYYYDRHFVNEIDNEEDFENVRLGIVPFDYQDQKIFGHQNYAALTRCLKKNGMKRPLFVVDKAFDFLPIKPAIQALGLPLVFFSDFQPNPDQKDVEKGLKVFEDDHCDSIVSIGGGTALDIGKNIKHLIYRDQYSLSLEESCDVAYQDLPNVPMIAIPTTSGTGSESTHFAVEYLDGIKHSNAFPYLLPNFVFLFPELTYSVPLFQKKCTMMDAFCQCIESTWSKKATKQSRCYAKQGIALFLKNYQGVLAGDKAAMAQMQIVANCSGKAINISETTAAHALSYSLTTDFHIPHGQAVSILLPLVWEENNKLSTSRSSWRVSIARAFDGKSSEKALELFNEVMLAVNNSIKLPANVDVDELSGKVNVTRLSNNPENFSASAIRKFYLSLLQK